MFIGFKLFINNLKNDDVNEYYNCYSNFLMSKNYMKENILNYRMNFLINYYVDCKEKMNKKDLIEYYMCNIKDDYDTIRLKKMEMVHEFKDDIEEKRDEDIELHYKDLYTVQYIEPKEEEEEELIDPDLKSETLTYLSDDDYYDDIDYYEEEYYEDTDNIEENYLYSDEEY